MGLVFIFSLHASARVCACATFFAFSFLSSSIVATVSFLRLLLYDVVCIVVLLGCVFSFQAVYIPATMLQGDNAAVESVGSAIGDLSGIVSCEHPNKIIHSFAGNIKRSTGQTIPFGMQNFLLRGSVLAKCDWCIGLVVYTGAETKVMKNNSKTPSKMSQTDKTVNILLSIAIAVQVGPNK